MNNASASQLQVLTYLAADETRRMHLKYGDDALEVWYTPADREAPITPAVVVLTMKHNGWLQRCDDTFPLWTGMQTYCLPERVLREAQEYLCGLAGERTQCT